MAEPGGVEAGRSEAEEALADAAPTTAEEVEAALFAAELCGGVGVIFAPAPDVATDDAPAAGMPDPPVGFGAVALGATGPGLRASGFVDEAPVPAGAFGPPAPPSAVFFGAGSPPAADETGRIAPAPSPGAPFGSGLPGAAPASAALGASERRNCPSGRSMVGGSRRRGSGRRVSLIVADRS
ncbi:hypothetical protein [uncultured Enterovirga sp.]|uniref:hypothetical protein n=1 Tax=uncultured Enterovirga sp. TaxID=2026352 RepID=UPI0035CC163B